MDSTKSEVHSEAKRCGWRCKMLWTLLVLFVLMLLSVAAAIIWLGPIVERYVEKHDMELVGRRVSMDNLSIKLFNGHVSVDNLVLYEADDLSEFVRIGSAQVDISLSDIFDKHVHVTRVLLSAPNFAVQQDGGSFNFDDLIAFVSAEYGGDEEPDTEPSEWMVTLENIAVEEGAVTYYDVAIAQQWQLAQVNIATPCLALDGDDTHIEMQMTINDEGSLAGILDINLDSLDYIFKGDVDNFNIAHTYSYVAPYINIGVLAGTTSLDCLLEGNISDILGTTISGELRFDNLLLTDKAGNTLFSANSIEATPQCVNIAQERYIFDNLTVDGYASRFIINDDGSTNFSNLFAADPEVSVETTTDEMSDNVYDVRERVTVTTDDQYAPLRNMTLEIGLLKFSNGDIYYADNTMHEPFEYRVTGLAVDSKNFEFMGKNTISIRAKLPKQGSAMFRWEGSLSDFYNQSLLATLSNVDMQGLSTYIEHYTAFPVLSGNMTFRSQNVVTNGKLSGVNQLGTYNFTVGKKDGTLDAEFKMPLKLGVYLLTDKDDHIDVDLPITGHIDSPEFSYRKVLWRAVGNLLLKVAAAPFEWMTKDKQDAFRYIDLDVMSAGLDSEHYARIDAMAEALKQDSTLKVRLTQRVNYQRAVQRISDMNLKIAYYNATEGREQGYLDMLDFSKIADMRLSGKAVSSFADSMLLARDISPANMTIKAKAKRLYGDMADSQLVSMMNRRNGIISGYVAFQHADVPAGAFAINDVVLEELKGYAGKDRYTVTLIIDDEEVEIGVDADDVSEVETSEDEFYDEDNNIDDSTLVGDDDAVTEGVETENEEVINN